MLNCIERYCHPKELSENLVLLWIMFVTTLIVLLNSLTLVVVWRVLPSRNIIDRQMTLVCLGGILGMLSFGIRDFRRVYLHLCLTTCVPAPNDYYFFPAFGMMLCIGSVIRITVILWTIICRLDSSTVNANNLWKNKENTAATVISVVLAVVFSLFNSLVRYLYINEIWRRRFHIIAAIIQYVVPIILVVACFIKSVSILREKTVHHEPSPQSAGLFKECKVAIFLSIIAFLVNATVNISYFYLIYLIQKNFDKYSEDTAAWFHHTKFVIAFSSGPIVYLISSQKARKAMVYLLKCKSRVSPVSDVR